MQHNQCGPINQSIYKVP